jgi:phthiocerol/phenolphthiocerol synthesis type-I polyketide synthase C
MNNEEDGMESEHREGSGKSMQDPMHEPVAIIGIGCCYPTARGPQELWQLLMEGRDAIGPYPGGRFRDLDAVYEQAAAGTRVIATHLGGFLPNVDRFDAAFFGISPREAAFIDPQQRLLLEVSWDALEDAGQVREQYYGSRTGVFTGLWATDYESHIYRTSEHPEFYQITGGGRSTVCGRISFSFGFEGPSISVDTACSSSMVAIHLGCQSLQLGECDMALAGGANVVLSTDVTRLFTTAGMLATDGHCKFGDIRANGFVRSEGAGIVVLKRLSDAVAANDSIYAVIRGSSVNSDGCSSGYLVTPSRTGQRMMLLEAWRQAGVTGADLCYIEAHGTGTQVGDPVEIGAISDALSETGATERVPIGSMKTNIGHTESAAGVAGVIKTALVLHHGMIPRSLHFEEPNPAIDWNGGPIEIAAETRELGASSNGKTRMAGASSFGLTGTNSHVVLAEFKTDEGQDHASATSGERLGFLLPITAYSAEALRKNAENWLEYLKQNQGSRELAEICYLAGARRTHLPHRFAAVGRDAAELRVQLEAFLAGEASTLPEAGAAGVEQARVVFVAPGQGSQWDGMARDLLRESAAFRDGMAACDRAIAVETGWSLLERLEGHDAARYLTEIDFVQPALFAMSVALAAVWRVAGVVPGAVVGHSMGEVAAAHLAGVLTLEDAAAVICRRSRLMRTLSGSGAMASVEMPAVELEKWLQSFDGKVSIAAANSPGTTVVAGEAEAVDQLLEWLELKEIFCRRIKVDVASHSALVDPILPELERELAHLQPQSGTLPLFSTVNGAYVDGSALDANYWVRNLREAVRLAAATSALASEGYNCFIELSPHPILVPALENTLRAGSAHPLSGQPPLAIVLPSLLRGNPAGQMMLRSLGRFWIRGGKLDWTELAGRGSGFSGPIDRRLRLPLYAFEHERFWEEEDESSSDASMQSAKLSPMLRARTDLANEPGTSIFTVHADLKSQPYLTDHRVGGAIVVPASAHIEIALEAARILSPDKTAQLKDLAFRQAVYLSEAEAQDLQLVVRRVPGQELFRFALMGRQGTGEGGWIEHSTGTIAFVASVSASGLAVSAEEDSTSRRGSKEEHYRKTRGSGLEYGPAFQLLESFETSHHAGVPVAKALLVLRGDAGSANDGYQLHPALLDCCFQVMIHLRPRVAGMSADDVYLPSALRRLEVFQLPANLPIGERGRFVTRAVFKGVDAEAGTMDFDLELRSEAGQLLAFAEGMTVQRVESRSGEKVAEDLFLMSWKALRPLPRPATGAGIGKHWLVFSDNGADNGANKGGGNGAQSRAATLAKRFAELGGRCTLVWIGERFRALSAGERRLDLLGADEYELPLNDAIALDQLLGLVAAEAGEISDVIDLWPLQGPDPSAGDVLEDLLHAQASGAKFIPSLVQAITRAGWSNPPRLWLFTEGTQTVPEAACARRLASATVWGMGAVLMHEHPELQTSVVDLSPEGNEQETDAVLQLVLQHHAGALREDRLAVRGERVFAARMTACPLRTEKLQARALAEGESYRVETERIGTLDQLQLRAIPGDAPGAGEVAIEVDYVGLNFIDVTKALGVCPGLDPKDPVEMGGECSGRIVAVGENVDGLRVGDKVIALTTSPLRVGLLASRVILPAALVMSKPLTLSQEEAAGLPIAYLTAHYSLNDLARIQRGEWVLIHAGAGGVGLAAAKIAIAAGARVIATASSPEKHAFLHAWGVEHVLQSRTLEFAGGVMEITGGRGVDIVLNSLAGDFIIKSIEVLAPYGRFVELGKRDIYDDRRVGLRGFRNNISYFAVDLAAMVEDKPAYAIRLFREVVNAIADGRWAPLPVQSFPATETSDALQFMAQGRHIGKLVVQFAGLNTRGEGTESLRVLPLRAAASTALFKRNATYLITGGLGGVGAAVAEWMAANGAGHLVLVSRRQAGPIENEVLQRIRAAGAAVEHRRVDLLDSEAVRNLVAEIDKTMPPLCGILHAAAVIDDALVTDLTPDRFDAVFGPKIRGTWYLHEATLGLPLDFFTMFSSIAVTFPQLGHGSYSAANAFLDAFAGYRRSLGLPATSINWSGWLGLGLARETGTSRSIEAYNASGLGSFERDEALYVLGQALEIDPQQAVAIRIDGDAVAASHEVIPSLLRDLVQTDGGHASSVPANREHAALAELASEGSFAERALKLEALLRLETSRVLKLAPERIKSNQPFGQMGIDSLMALEFIRRVNAALGLALPATAVFNYPTLTLLAAQILKRLGLDSDAIAESVLSAIDLPDRELDDSGAELSEDEALRALMEPGERSSGD